MQAKIVVFCYCLVAFFILNAQSFQNQQKRIKKNNNNNNTETK